MSAGWSEELSSSSSFLEDADGSGSPLEGSWIMSRPSWPRGCREEEAEEDFLSPGEVSVDKEDPIPEDEEKEAAVQGVAAAMPRFRKGLLNPSKSFGGGMKESKVMMPPMQPAVTPGRGRPEQEALSASLCSADPDRRSALSWRPSSSLCFCCWLRGGRPRFLPPTGGRFMSRADAASEGAVFLASDNCLATAAPFRAAAFCESPSCFPLWFVGVELPESPPPFETVMEEDGWRNRPNLPGSEGGATLRSPQKVERFLISDPHLNRVLFLSRSSETKAQPPSPSLPSLRPDDPCRHFHFRLKKGRMEVSRSWYFLLLTTVRLKSTRWTASTLE